MGARSKIEWTDSTFNPWVGCTKVAHGSGVPSACDFCYAEKWAKRSGQIEWGNHPRRRTTEAYWRNPLTWNSRARLFQTEHGRRQRVFCASLADVFDNQVDPAWRADLFNLIRECDQLDWQLLTKRPQNIRKMLPADWNDGYPNVWLGTTAEDARAYKQRASHLLKVPAAIHFVSYEPALGPLGQLDINGRSPAWVIIGGESGVRSDLIRLTDPEWARDAIAECRRVGAAPFLKQWGTYKNNPYVFERGLTEDQAMKIDPPNNGKGGGKLDGSLWREFPINTMQLRLEIGSRGRSAENGKRDPERYTQGNDGLIVEKVGRWAVNKIKILTDYVYASGGARKNFYRPGTAFIDVFSGPGRSLIRGTDQFIDGSPVAAFKRALESPGRFTSINISDADDELLAAAATRLKAINAPVRTFAGPASAAMPKVVQSLDPYGLHLAFLDPHNLGTLSFDLFEQLAKLKRVDVIAHVSLSDLQRNADRYTQEAHDQFNRFAPGWRDKVSTDMNQNAFRAAIIQYWCEKILELNFPQAPHWELITGD